jgi:hypothetical protein
MIYALFQNTCISRILAWKKGGQGSVTRVRAVPLLLLPGVVWPQRRSDCERKRKEKKSVYMQSIESLCASSPLGKNNTIWNIPDFNDQLVQAVSLINITINSFEKRLSWKYTDYTHTAGKSWCKTIRSLNKSYIVFVIWYRDACTLTSHNSDLIPQYKQYQIRPSLIPDTCRNAVGYKSGFLIQIGFLHVFLFWLSVLTL